MIPWPLLREFEPSRTPVAMELSGDCGRKFESPSKGCALANLVLVPPPTVRGMQCLVRFVVRPSLRPRGKTLIWPPIARVIRLTDEVVREKCAGCWIPEDGGTARAST